MILAAILGIAAAIAFWLFFFLLAYTILYGSLVFSYLFVWDSQTRAQICPKGLFHSILHDD